MKDRVIFREIVDGKKAKETKEIRYMLMSSKEVYEHFKNEFPEVLLELLKFCSLRRFHVKLLDQIHHNVCVCKYHENILLILIVLEKYNFDSFVDQVTFDQSNKDHIYRNCDKCKDLLDMLKPLFDVGETLTTYEQWQSEKKHAEKLTISGTVHDIFEDLKINLTDFLEHRYVKKKQQAHFGELIETCDSRSVVLQVDFSENASISHENKIQSAHWSHQQVTVFTSHVWVDNNEKESYAIIFDNLEHTEVAVYTFMTELFGDIMQIIHQLT